MFERSEKTINSLSDLLPHPLLKTPSRTRKSLQTERPPSFRPQWRYLLLNWSSFLSWHHDMDNQSVPQYHGQALVQKIVHLGQNHRGRGVVVFVCLVPLASDALMSVRLLQERQQFLLLTSLLYLLQKRHHQQHFR